MSTRLVMLLAVAMFALCNAAAMSANTTQSPWILDDWDCAKNTIHPGVPMLDKSWDWDPTWPVSGPGDPSHLYQLCGPAPDPDDPDVLQTVRNRSQTAWTDWHVSIVNGTYTAGSAVVYNNSATSPEWVIEAYEDGSGFFAHVVTGQNTQVDYYETLHIFFSYTVDDFEQEVSITEYPTNYYPIPEPASVMGLLAGCLTFGFRMRRRA